LCPLVLPRENTCSDEDEDLVMGEVAGQAERDAAMFAAWRDGETQAAIGERYGITQQAVSLAIGRHLDQLPDQDKAAEVRRTLALVDDLVQVYAPKARAGDAASSREVRGLLALRGRYLGIDRREVLVEHGGTVEHAWTPGPTVAEVLDDWRRRGIIRGQLTRTDQDQAPDQVQVPVEAEVLEAGP
jgi:hypothetical protein